MPEDEDRPWRWRNCRELSVALVIVPMPWSWRFGAERQNVNYLGGSWAVALGPVVIRIEAWIGNISVEGWQRHFGLSESEAWERSK
jgi:hypothetical protein